MPRYFNRVVNNRYSVILRKCTSLRFIRIILANLVCLILFTVTIWMARRHGNKLQIPTQPNGGVYYVSKRALCSQSIAYEQLGIQPIAVSKVILRPVVQNRVTEAYDDRLEVLENAMINDVVFLDR